MVLISVAPPAMYGIAIGLVFCVKIMVWKYNFKGFHLALPHAMAPFPSTFIPATHVRGRCEPEDGPIDLTPHFSSSSPDCWTTWCSGFPGIDVSSEPVPNNLWKMWALSFPNYQFLQL